MKKLICLFLALVLSLSLLPVQGQATVYVRHPVSGKRTLDVHSRTASAEGSGPQLAEGNYERWIDRLADLPEYAREFYQWLEENAGADGALANPLLGTQVQGEYGYFVSGYSSTLHVPCSEEELDQVTYDAAVDAMYEAFNEISDYAGAVYDAFDRDHPEIFWLSGEGLYGFYSNGYTYSYSDGLATISFEIEVMFYLQAEGFDIRATAYQTPEAVARDIARRDEAVQGILSECPGSSAEAQLRYLNRVLTQRNAYNSAVAEGYGYAAEDLAWECTSALLGSAGVEGPVCEGYSRAFMVLCRQLGIPCVLVDGPARVSRFDQPEDHMWNYVQLDGSWYAVDVTWNDPYDEVKPLEKISGFESEEWMLLGADAEVAPDLSFIESHQVENQITDGGIMHLNGPVLSTVSYEPGNATGVLSGTISSFGDAGEPVTLTLYRPGEETPVLEQILSGGNTGFSFEGLESGSYILKISKPGHVSREYQVSTEGSLALALVICTMGDVTADGIVDIGDVAKVYACVKDSSLIEDAYFLHCADLNGDNQVNIGDVAKAYAGVKNQ